jgi:hypothetical protein
MAKYQQNFACYVLHISVHVYFNECLLCVFNVKLYVGACINLLVETKMHLSEKSS